MKPTHIEHIGIAVKNLENSEKVFSALFGKAPYKHESVESEGVTTSFFKAGPNKITVTHSEQENGKWILKSEIITLD